MNLGSFVNKKWDTMAPTNIIQLYIVIGIGGSISATRGDIMQIIRATRFPRPKAVEQSLTGISWTIAMKHILFAAATPNLAIIMKKGIKSTLFLNKISSIDPIRDSKNMDEKAYLGPSHR